MEHTAACKWTECGWRESWTTEAAAEAAGVHHIYNEHPRVWERVTGGMPKPKQPLPETLGRRFEGWEKQS